MTHFYGVGRQTALRLCARVQIHDRCRVRNLNQSQVTALTAFLPTLLSDILILMQRSGITYAVFSFVSSNVQCAC